MEIYLVRHGIAEDISRAEARGEGDSGRRLTPEGREKTANVAEAFRKKIGDRLDWIGHSPYERARETAEIFAAEFPQAKRNIVACLTPDDGAAGALKILRGRGRGEVVMLVGHEPNLSSLAGLLLTGQERPVLEFKKAGIAAFDWNGVGHAQLLFLVPPRFMKG